MSNVNIISRFYIFWSSKFFSLFSFSYFALKMILTFFAFIFLALEITTTDGTSNVNIFDIYIFSCFKRIPFL